ncbi:MAG: UbiA family prenyltransferase [Candidatus Thermoplasmatota archaeon]|jgi:4-hydroxybenzoate polyprenyltransferase|nr:UbiA family prenyltransferase [Candidatus Thermoplasmatota archaeon]
MGRGKIKELLKLCRLPLSIGASVTPVIGALSVKGFLLDNLYFLPLLLLGIFSNILGFVLNDYLDIKIDEFSEELKDRPLVKKTVSKKTALIIIFLCSIVIFSITITFFLKVLAILVLIISIVLGIFYDVFSKKLIGSETFLACSMAFFCLFGALAVSDNINSIYEIGDLTWMVVLIIFFHMFIMNVFEGNLKDADFDRKAKALTIPIFLGVKINKKMHITTSFKVLIIVLKIFLVFLVFSTFFFFDLTFWYWQVFLLILLVIGMIWTTFKILKMNSFRLDEFAMYARRHGVFSYLLIPVMLMRFIGINWTLFLILFPASCPLIFNYLLYGKSLIPVAYIK